MTEVYCNTCKHHVINYDAEYEDEDCMRIICKECLENKELMEIAESRKGQETIRVNMEDL